MSKLFFVLPVALAIALSSCSAGLKNQINGKWVQVDPQLSTRICEVEFTGNLYTSECTDTPEYSKESGNPPLVAKEVLDFELVGSDQIVFTSGGKKYTSKIKLEDESLSITDTNNKWNKYKKKTK
jgi:hypothetical protein